MPEVNARLFKTYDIRGEAGKDLTPEVATTVGWAIGTFFRRHYRQTQVAVGYDMRLSSEALRSGLVAGLNAAGCDTYDIGLVATPVLYGVAFRLGMAGVMITGSHLAKEHNGFKLVSGKKAVFGDDLQEIYRLGQTNDFEEGAGRRFLLSEINAAYISMLATGFRQGRRLKVVVDAGNGMGGIYAPVLLRTLGHEVIELYCEPDGSFPNHHPNPEKASNVADLSKKVREAGADVGLAFDGDADRVGVVDEKGELISADKVMAWLATDIVRRNPEAIFVGDVLSSQVVFDVVEQYGGKGILWKSGHARIKDKMQTENALFGGESSGHMFFGDRYTGFDDGIYAAGRVVELLSAGDKSLSIHIADLPAMFTSPEYRPHCPEEKKAAIINEVKQRLGDLPMVDVDGLRVLFPNGWGLLRPSGTEPVLSLRFEARTETDTWHYKDRIVSVLKQVYPEVEDF